MNDRFKFRAINMSTKEITYIDSFYWFEENGVSEIDSNNTASGVFAEYWINQCTGLKDKNGKLIYEGDIVEAKQKPDREGWYCVYRGIAKYDNKKCQYVINSSHHKVLNENKLIKSALNTDTSFNWFDWFEVIGNIYENPELLEATND